ncbi:MAG: MbcA/ParS/Xre antitoxin family protein [Candidatus Korobacteraceae bacterium]
MAGKTGYARDMLDLDLDLKQDLGISEADWDAIFEVIVAEFDIPPINKFQPLNFQTLARVIKFVESIQTELGGGKAISGSSRQTEPQALRSQGAVTQRGVRRSPIKDKLHSRVDAQSMEYAQVLAHAVDTFGSRSNANSWLNKPNRVFHNQSPLQILTQDPAAVEEELVRIDHGMFI